jgi:hypothetical protein
VILDNPADGTRAKGIGRFVQAKLG